jgi:GNAT superfamily N-acetyltransferase
MPVPRIVPFTQDHLEPAARLLADRQRRWRAAQPDLPERYCEPTAWAAILEARRSSADGVGFAAESDDGRLAAFMLAGLRLEEIWGRSGWAWLDAQAVAADEDADVIRDLYAAVGDRFVERGIFAHYAVVPDAFGEAVDAWTRAGFGKMQTHAIRSADPDSLGAPPEGLVIRPATPADIDLVEQVCDLIARALLEAPTFSVTLPERWQRYRADWLEELEQPEGDVLLALDERNGRVLGLAAFYPAEPAPHTPEGAVELGVAMTAPSARGRGVMRALLREGLERAGKGGAASCITDWRTANLTASRAWPALGFRPLYWRMHRMVDHRITWARLAAPPR